MEYQSTSKSTVVFISLVAIVFALWALINVWNYQPDVIVIDRQTIVNQTIIQPTIETTTTNTVVEKMVGYDPMADCITIGDLNQESYTLKCYNRITPTN